MDAGDINSILWSVSDFVCVHDNCHLLNTPYVSDILLSSLFTCQNLKQLFVTIEEVRLMEFK